MVRLPMCMLMAAGKETTGSSVLRGQGCSPDSLNLRDARLPGVGSMPSKQSSQSKQELSLYWIPKAIKNSHKPC
ncbi:hypothetical protein HYQ44_003290 [Verticillium longisporum]|nr:hypothetical protein HYQ44_003290 [Verticillium longisporum]